MNMTRVEIEKLKGPALCWIIGDYTENVDIRENPPRVVLIDGAGNDVQYRPDTDWAQGGPLLARYWSEIREYYPDPADWPHGDAANELLPWALRIIVGIIYPGDVYAQVPSLLVPQDIAPSEKYSEMLRPTNDLYGPELDWAVMLADGWIPHNMRTGTMLDQRRSGDIKRVGPAATSISLNEYHSPSTRAEHGQDLIARHLIGTTFGKSLGKWIGALPDSKDGQYGNTNLVAACRAFVAAKLGQAVNVPVSLGNGYWRQCSAPDCWMCNGTGVDPTGYICTGIEDLPF